MVLLMRGGSIRSWREVGEVLSDLGCFVLLVVLTGGFALFLLAILIRSA